MRARQVTAQRYAKALFLAAREAGSALAVTQELGAFAQALATHPEARDVLTRPWIKAADRRGIARLIAEKSGASPLVRDFAGLWQAADKIVYSTTLDAVSTAKTRLERHFDPDSIRSMKDAATQDLAVGGANLAAHAFMAGLVDECHLFIRPVLVGQGKPAFPSDARAQLELLEEHRFGNGVVYVRYRTPS